MFVALCRVGKRYSNEINSLLRLEFLEFGAIGEHLFISLKYVYDTRRQYMT